MPAIVWPQRFCPKMLANDPGAIGCDGSNDAAFIIVICAKDGEATAMNKKEIIANIEKVFIASLDLL